MTDNQTQADEDAWNVYKFENWVNEQREPYTKGVFMAGRASVAAVAPATRDELAVTITRAIYAKRSPKNAKEIDPYVIADAVLAHTPPSVNRTESDTDEGDTK